MKLKAVLAGALIALVPTSLVLAQGLPSANQVYAGPTSGSPAAPAFRVLVPADIPVSTSLDVIGSTRGSVLERGATGWQIITPGTSGLPWVSNGTGADPSYQALTAAGIAAATVTNGNLANMAADTVKCNPTTSSASPQDCTTPILGTPPASPGNNVIQETLTGVSAPVAFGFYNGSSTAPTTTTNPLLYLQRHIAPQLGSEGAQTVGGFFLDTESHGSGTVTPNLGAVIGALYSTNAVSVNQGTPTAPNFDLKGDVVGVAGFAYNSGAPYPGHIITGIWAYAQGPTLDATTYANLPAGNWSTAGFEINVTYNHPDPGVQTVLVGEGSSVGANFFNFRPTSSGIKNWTFGINFGGTPNDGNFSNPDVEDWNGFHTGLLIDKYYNYGILFGQYADTGSYGIAFPTSMTAMTRRPAANIRLGDGVINMGDYLGSGNNNGDLFSSGGSLLFTQSSLNNTVVLQNPSGHISVGGGGTPTISAGCNGTGDSIGGTDFAFNVTGQTATATTCTINFAHTFGAVPVCVVSGNQSAILTKSQSTTQLVVTFASTTNYGFSAVCLGT